MKLIFIHGWAMNHTIWHPTIKALTNERPDCKCETIDLGFIKSDAVIKGVINHQQPNAIERLTAHEPVIVIGHSLGVMWALRHLLENGQLKAFISIAGFSCFTSFTPSQTLAKMQQGLSQNQASQLALFWRRAGCRDLANQIDLSSDPNIQALQQGLEHLACWDESASISKLNCPKLFLASKADKIVPQAATRSQWPDQTIRWHDAAPHTIQLADPQWVAQNIIDFISKNNDECSVS